MLYNNFIDVTILEYYDQKSFDNHGIDNDIMSMALRYHINYLRDVEYRGTYHFHYNIVTLLNYSSRLNNTKQTKCY